MAKITAPVAGFDGVVVGVHFTDGSGETDDEGAIAYFDRQGYTVVGGEPAGKPFSQLNKAELEAVATAEEIDISKATTNDEIRAVIKAARK